MGDGYKVCGKPVIHKDDPDFDLASTHQAAFHRHNSVRDSDPGLELAHQSALRRVAARNGARLTSRWSSLVHAHCAERASGCGCWLPRGASGCLVHAGQTEKKERKTAWSRMLESDTEEEEMSSGEWSGLMAKMKPDAPKGALKPAKPKKVEPPPKNVEAPAKPAPGAWYDLMDKMKTDAPAGALRKKTAAAPRVISEAEASKEEWLASQVQRVSLDFLFAGLTLFAGHPDPPRQLRHPLPRLLHVARARALLPLPGRARAARHGRGRV